MPACVSCTSPMALGAIQCVRCGAWALAPAAGMVGSTITAGDLIDAVDVDGAKIEHVATGPWDPVFGGGAVPGSTILMCGLAGAGKSTLLLQIAAILAQLTGRPSYYVSGEQAKEDLRFTLDRLQIKLERGQLRLAKTMNSSGLIDDAVLAAAPPSSVIVDSLTEICGTKQYDRQVALAKAYKEPVAARYQCPVFLISQMSKSGDTLGMAALQHGPDALIEIDTMERDPRRRNRVLREHCIEGDPDLRALAAIKNRFGPSFVPTYLVMGEHGLEALPPPPKKLKQRTGDALADAVLGLDELDEEEEALRARLTEIKGERAEQKGRLARIAAAKQRGAKPS